MEERGEEIKGQAKGRICGSFVFGHLRDQCECGRRGSRAASGVSFLQQNGGPRSSITSTNRLTEALADCMKSICGTPSASILSL
ncbi:hypothetical protein ASE63_02435 [Bosea sp. Root381]|nr:hypothetical protein ASE63_02435 [Bosea sp. Root381]